MIIYDRSKKELFIPKGIGNFSNGSYEDGYERGRAAQAAEDEAKLSTTAITSNGEYNADYGFSSVVVDVDCSGGTCNLQSLNRTPMASELVDGKYLEYAASATTGLDGWDNIKLDMGYIIAKGERNQKAKLASKTITENGEYTRADGWSSVTVNVSDYHMLMCSGVIVTSATTQLTITGGNDTYIFVGLNDAYKYLKVNGEWRSLISMEMDGVELPAGTYEWMAYLFDNDNGWLGVYTANGTPIYENDFYGYKPTYNYYIN